VLDLLKPGGGFQPCFFQMPNRYAETTRSGDGLLMATAWRILLNKYEDIFHLSPLLRTTPFYEDTVAFRTFGEFLRFAQCRRDILV
jgi:hypothetical protein